MSGNYSWNQGDSIQTESGTHLGVVERTTETNGYETIILGEVNTDILDIVMGFNPNDTKAGDIAILVETVVDYKDNCVVVDDINEEQIQSSYDLMVKDEIEARLDTVEESVMNGDISTIEQANELQEHLRKFRKDIRTAGQHGHIDYTEEILERIDKIDKGITKGITRILKNKNANSGGSESINESNSKDNRQSNETKDDAVEERMVEFAEYINNEFSTAIEDASPNERPKMARQALREAKELRAMIREFDKAGELEDEDHWYDKIDDIEEHLREEERRAIRHAEKNSQSFMESLAEGVKTYQELKRNPTGKDNSSEPNRPSNRQSRRQTRENPESEKQTGSNDPYTGGKSQSSSISESVSRFWNTVTFKNAFSPKCPNCNRKSSAPVSGEEDVYQCDNCGNIFDTHPDSRREVDFE